MVGLASWQDWYHGRTGIMPGLVSCQDWHHGRTGIMVDSPSCCTSNLAMISSQKYCSHSKGVQAEDIQTREILSRSSLWQDWYHGRTGIMEGLVSWQNWYHGRTGIMVGLASWQDWHHGRTGIMLDCGRCCIIQESFLLLTSPGASSHWL